MSIERTFAIIKPDAVARGQQGEILSRIHRAGFKIVAIKSMRLTKEEAGGFYAVHKQRPFFGELTDFMSSGQIFAMVLEADGGILKWRDTMGATDPKKAAPGTIRHDLGTSIGNNCTHGSDAPETAAFEIAYFFSGLELISAPANRYLWGNDTTCPDLVGIAPPLSLFLRPYLVTSLLHFFLHSFSWILSANSAASSSFSAPSWSLSALRFTSGENSHCASAASPATSSTAANTPPSTSRSSPASFSASVFLSSFGFLGSSASNQVFSFASFNSSISFTSFSQRRTPRG